MTGDSRGRAIARASSSPGAPFNILYRFSLFLSIIFLGTLALFSPPPFRPAVDSLMTRAARGYCESRSDRSRFATNAEGNGNGWSNNCQITSPMLSDLHPCAFLFESVTTESPAIPQYYALRARVASSPSPAPWTSGSRRYDQSCAVQSTHNYFLATRNTEKSPHTPAAFLRKTRHLHYIRMYLCRFGCSSS